MRKLKFELGFQLFRLKSISRMNLSVRNKVRYFVTSFGSVTYHLSKGMYRASRIVK